MVMVTGTVTECCSTPLVAVTVMLPVRVFALVEPPAEDWTPQLAAVSRQSPANPMGIQRRRVAAQKGSPVAQAIAKKRNGPRGTARKRWVRRAAGEVLATVRAAVPDPFTGPDTEQVVFVSESETAHVKLTPPAKFAKRVT